MCNVFVENYTNDVQTQLLKQYKQIMTLKHFAYTINRDRKA